MFHIAEDEYVPGNLLFVERHTIKTTDGTTTSLIAGSSTSYGYLEDVGANARFDDILSFVQLSKARVILTDSDNHCLRKIPTSNLYRILIITVSEALTEQLAEHLPMLVTVHSEVSEMALMLY